MAGEADLRAAVRAIRRDAAAVEHADEAQLHLGEVELDMRTVLRDLDGRVVFTPPRPTDARGRDTGLDLGAPVTGDRHLGLHVPSEMKDEENGRQRDSDEYAIEAGVRCRGFFLV